MFEPGGAGRFGVDMSNEKAGRCGHDSSAGLCVWVPCSQRLPEKNQFFLAFGPGLGNHVGGPEMDICSFDGDLWVEGGTELAFDEQRFTHWMPMPEGPNV